MANWCPCFCAAVLYAGTVMRPGDMWGRTVFHEPCIVFVRSCVRYGPVFSGGS